MADTLVAFQEIRIDVRDPELTQVYVFIENTSNDGCNWIEGWHHKTFPARMTSVEILGSWEEDSPLLWAMKAPPNTA